MKLQHIALNNFRNFLKQEFNFSLTLTIIAGQNARGKTNLLESIYTLINGSGFRESKEEELINIKKLEASIEGVYQLSGNILKYKINFINKNGIVSKVYFINKTKKNLNQYLQEQTKAILFTPEQIMIITGSPETRRDYFNKFISSYDGEYKKKLINLENALRRRNKILEVVHDDFKLREELSFWNQYIIKQGSYITKKREGYVHYLNNHPTLDSKSFYIKYIKNEITDTRLKEVFEAEKKWRRTLIGPQKDDYQIFLKNEDEKNVHHYGSRSEQRLAIFWLKVNEINYFEDNFKTKPILLLDDVLSELDLYNKQLILNLIKNYQTVLTTTEKEVGNLIEGTKEVIEL